MTFRDAIVIGDVVAGHLRVVREIGRGGMGILYEVEDTALRRRAAVKVMTGELAHDPVLRDRLVREARAVAQLESPHAVTVFEVGALPDGAPFVVMELLEGETVEAVLEREGPLAIDVCLDWIAQALDAVAEAHRRGLVHRDLKPANLFVTRGRGEVVVKVLDFGLVADRAADARLTQTGEQLGTPLYMAPEQVLGARDVDARADVWAAGVTLYEMLTRRVPFEHASVPALFRAITVGDAVPVQARRPGVPPCVVALLGRCLARDRWARFPDGAALRDAVTAARATLARVDAAPPTLDEAREAAALQPTVPGGAARIPPVPRALPRRALRAEPTRRPVFVLAAIATLAVGTLLLLAASRALRRNADSAPIAVTSAPRSAAAPPPPAPIPPVAPVAVRSAAVPVSGAAGPPLSHRCACVALAEESTASTYTLCSPERARPHHDDCECEGRGGALYARTDGVAAFGVFRSASGFGGEPCEGYRNGELETGVVTCGVCGQYDVFVGTDGKPCHGYNGRGRVLRAGKLACP